MSFVLRFRLISLFLILFIMGCDLMINNHAADQHFTDPQVVKLANASLEGDIDEIDRLLESGVDINTVGKAGLNPIYWLLVHNEENEAKKIGFRHLLKNDANVFQVYTTTNSILLHVIAGYVDSDYLQMVLEEQPDIDIDFEKSEATWSTPLLSALFSNRYENFKRLIDHGADIEKKNSRGDTPLDMASDNGTWQFAYLLLQKGSDYKGGEVNFISGEADEEPEIIWSLEDSIYWPSVSMNYRNADYRQKVIEFLWAKGVEVNPWMPEEEEYRIENGVSVLYIKEENGEWLKFTESSRYRD